LEAVVFSLSSLILPSSSFLLGVVIVTENRSKARFEIRQILAPETFPLRLRVLRPGRPAESAHFPGDETAHHFGAFQDGELRSIASMFPVEMPERPAVPALQLRGMATAPEARGAGLGCALLKACTNFALESAIRLIWCNARITAVGFYQKMGFSISGGEFEIPEVGPHFRMFYELP
jgi:GNAT superfamily N-acetyltransferase